MTHAGLHDSRSSWGKRRASSGLLCVGVQPETSNSDGTVCESSVPAIRSRRPINLERSMATKARKTAKKVQKRVTTAGKAAMKKVEPSLRARAAKAAKALRAAVARVKGTRAAQIAAGALAASAVMAAGYAAGKARKAKRKRPW